MSCKLEMNKISDRDKLFIQKSLMIDHERMKTFVFKVNEEYDAVAIPFNFAHRNFVIERPPLQASAYDEETPLSFEGQLRPKQLEVRKRCIELLDETGCAILAAQPGFGKTVTAIEIICRLNQRTIIFVKQQLIVQQWLDALKLYAPSKTVHLVRNSAKLDETADIYILNPLLLKDKEISDYIERRKFLARVQILSNMKFLVVDELHQLVSKVMLRAFLKVHPDYVLGLSATPRRPVNDPFQIVIEWIFGRNIVGEQLFHRHKVFMVRTSFRPSSVKFKGRCLDWNHILTEQSKDEDRNKMIVDIVISRPKRVWLLLVKRVNHAEILKTMFEERGVSCETLTGSKRVFDKECRILIGTTSKIGVGFDHSPINALFVAADVVEYFEQFLGRCMRIPNNVPVVYDMEDSYSILFRHSLIRMDTYLRHGGRLVFHDKFDALPLRGAPEGPQDEGRTPGFANTSTLRGSTLWGSTLRGAPEGPNLLSDSPRETLSDP